MNKVERAVIMAAGTGMRMRPLTETMPKPLIPVHGQPMIEGIIEALNARGIKDIAVVAGYLCDKLEYLKSKYGVQIAYNPDFDKANNIASLFYARRLLDTNVVILDGDQIINDISVIKTEFEHSGYSCWYSRAFSNEWMLFLGDGEKVTSCSRNGGARAWELKSLSYWTAADAQKLAELVESEYCGGNTRIYWDDVPVFLHKDSFDLRAHKIPRGSITEIDSVKELIDEDEYYSYLEEK